MFARAVLYFCWPKSSYIHNSIPFIAGLTAMVTQARGNLDPLILQSVISSTSRSKDERGTLYPVPFQGAGMAQAYDAAFARTILSHQASLSMIPPTEQRVPFQSLMTAKTLSSIHFHLFHSKLFQDLKLAKMVLQQVNEYTGDLPTLNCLPRSSSSLQARHRL